MTLRKKVLVLSLAVLLLGIVGYATRYEYVRTGRDAVYRINRWTGSTELIIGTRIVPVAAQPSRTATTPPATLPKDFSGQPPPVGAVLSEEEFKQRYPSGTESSARPSSPGEQSQPPAQR